MMLFCCSCSKVMRLNFGDGNFVVGGSVMWAVSYTHLNDKLGRDRDSF